LFHQASHVEDAGLNESRIRTHGFGDLDDFKTLFDDIATASAVTVVKPANGFGFGALQRGEVGPPEKKGASEWGGEIVAGNFQSRREIVFENSAQAIASVDLLVN
jgi:hypothetical protein